MGLQEKYHEMYQFKNKLLYFLSMVWIISSCSQRADDATDQPTQMEMYAQSVEKCLTKNWKLSIEEDSSKLEQLTNVGKPLAKWTFSDNKNHQFSWFLLKRTKETENKLQWILTNAAYMDAAHLPILIQSTKTYLIVEEMTSGMTIIANEQSEIVACSLKNLK